MTPEDHARAAADLLEAERTGKQIGLLTLRHPEMGMDDAYAVQNALFEAKLGAGAQGDRLEDRADLQGDAKRAEYRHPR